MGNCGRREEGGRMGGKEGEEREGGGGRIGKC